MKNKKQIVALGLVSLLNLVPASHAMTTDNHGQMDTQVTAVAYSPTVDLANPFHNTGCANFGSCATQV